MNLLQNNIPCQYNVFVYFSDTVFTADKVV